MESPAAHRRDWIPELAALLGLAGLSTAVFGLTNLDIVASRWFHLPDAPEPWATAHRMPWRLVSGAAPWVTASLLLIGLGALSAGVSGRGVSTRWGGIFLLLCLIVGPGLVINAILKDHWGRPRPREIVEFGGPLRHAPPPLPCSQGGKSFPCGDCSVGFLCAAGWWVWKRRRPGLAWASLVTGIALGFAIGLERMAAGGHFLSDAVWSGLIVLTIAHALHHLMLRRQANLAGFFGV